MQRARGGQGDDYQEDSQNAEDQQYEDEYEADEPKQAEQQQERGKKKERQLDLSRLDQKSVKTMVMLMLFLLENNMTAAEFFKPVLFA
jgi:hypothetical protein